MRFALATSLATLGALLVVGVAVGPDVPQAGTTSVPLLVAFAVGLTAGGLSCLAVQSGLLTVAVTDPAARSSVGAAHSSSASILWFLGAKLVAYTLLGAALGALGQLIAPGPDVRMVMQFAAAALMFATAFDLLGVHPIFRHATIQPPRAVTRRIGIASRSTSAFAPAALGAFTVFLPCGVTQAMQLVAINSGNPAVGAATMAAFIIGTSPLFFSFGYFAVRLGDALQARFFKFAGAAVLVIALLTFNAALKLSGSPVTLGSLNSQLLSPPKPVPARAAPDGSQTATILAGARGYRPKVLELQAGKPTRLVFAGDGSAGCPLALLFQGQEYTLTPTSEVPIDLPALKPGQRIKYSCSMGMASAEIRVL